MLRIAIRAGWAFVASQGAILLLLARYGTLWLYGPGPFLLRPAMYLLGAAALVVGLYHALAWQTMWFATLCDITDVRLARHAPKLWTWWHRAEIARGDWLPGDEAYPVANYQRQDMAALGESARLHKLMIAAGARWDGQDGYDLSVPWPEDNDTVLVLHPDGQRREEDAPPRPRFHFNDDHYPGLVPTPMEGCDCGRCNYLRALADDGCFTQGSDPVLRSHRCDKEA